MIIIGDRFIEPKEWTRVPVLTTLIAFTARVCEMPWLRRKRGEEMYEMGRLSF